MTLPFKSPHTPQAPVREYGQFAEIGRSGLKRYGGYVYEEYLPKLQGNKALQIYEEMRTNDPTVGAILFAIEMLIRQVEWRVEPGGDSAEDVEAAEFIESCLYDMNQSWEETVSEILTMLPFGFCWMEQVYKQRQGPKGQRRSAYTDGKIGWRKWAIRAQLTRWKWEFDPEGGILGMWQSAAPTFQPVFIPIEKSLLFRPKLAKNNPEGFSILRTAYRSWYFLKRIEEIEAIGIERDLAGFPVIECPAEITMSSAPADQQTVYNTLKQIVQNVRRDQQEGIVMPQAYDPETKMPLYKFSLMTSGGKREFDVNAVITRKQTDITRSVLAEFLMLGSGETGSFALASDKTRLFATAIGTWLQQVCGPINQYAIPRLLELNGYSASVQEHPPTLCHGDIEKPDLGVLGDFIQKLAAAGVPLFPDPKAENILRELAGLPEMTEDEIEEREVEDEADKALAAEMQAAALAAPVMEEKKPEEMKEKEEPVAKVVEVVKEVVPQEPLRIELAVTTPASTVTIENAPLIPVEPVAPTTKRFTFVRDLMGRLTGATVEEKKDV